MSNAESAPDGPRDVEKRRYQSPRTGATGWRWYFDHPSCPEWGYVRKRDAEAAMTKELEADRQYLEAGDGGYTGRSEW